MTREVEALGLKAKQVVGGAEVEGPEGSYEVCNLWLRIASRVQLKIAELKSPAQLTQLNVSNWVAQGGPVSFEVSGHRAHEWKSAAARKWPLPSGAETPAQVLIRDVDGVCTVSIDTSGTPLYQRGARQEVGKAPMRETLAAGVLSLCGYDGTTPLWDIMCGSGTLVIEAAEISRGLAPGRMREFAFERFPSHDRQRWQGRAKVRPAVGAHTVKGTDLNAGALGVARRNARRAGVGEFMTLERVDATKLPVPAGPPGLIVANVPYGKRVGEAGELSALFKAVGSSLKQSCAGWRYGVLTNSEVTAFGLPISGHADVSNGGLRCSVIWGEIPKR